jgi:hypothetical protein
MDAVFRELENIVVIKTNKNNLYGINYTETPYKMCILSAGISFNELEKLNTIYPIKTINNSITNTQTNKFKISLKEYNRKCKCIYYRRYNFFNIHQMYIENDDWYLIVSDCFDINQIKYIINLPHQTKSYFFNRKTYKCTCDKYKKHKICEHKSIFISSVNDIKYYFTLILINNLNITITECLDILTYSNNFI